MSATRPVALVTGGARRVGAAIGRALHAEGFDVIVHCRRSVDAARELAAGLEAARAGSAHVVRGELRAAHDAERVAREALAWRGACDLLVNNASTFEPGAVGDVDEAQWEALVGSNLKAPFFLTQALAPALASAGGAVVNLLDVHAERPLPGYPLYSTAKAGLAMLTRALAVELAPDVRVNGVAPGAVLWPEDEPESAPARERLVRRIPLRRMGEPEDVAGAVCYLARAPYVTGQILAVDGGRSVAI